MRYVAMAMGISHRPIRDYLQYLGTDLIRVPPSQLFNNPPTLLPPLEVKFAVGDKTFKLELVVGDKTPALPAGIDAAALEALTENFINFIAGIIIVEYQNFCIKCVSSNYFIKYTSLDYDPVARKFGISYIDTEAFEEELAKSEGKTRMELLADWDYSEREKAVNKKLQTCKKLYLAIRPVASSKK